MLKENILKFSENELFNNDILKQYDEEAQKGFLGYLFRNYNWSIIDNQIVFPEIQTDEEIEDLLEGYDTDIKRNNLNIKKDILDMVLVLGFARIKDMVNDEERKIKERENKSKEFER